MQTTTMTPPLFTINVFAKPLVVSLLLALSAQIYIPIGWVPMTFQSFAVLLIGLSCRPQTAALSVLYYLLEIGIGLPFAAGLKGRLLVLAGPTSGFLFGFLLAATIGAFIAQKGNKLSTLFIAGFVMTGCTYLPGILWLSTFLGFEKALTVGVIPFLPEIPAFITLAAIFAYKLKSYTSK